MSTTPPTAEVGGVDVRRFGAKGDGVADDTAAIEAAAAVAFESFVPLYFSGGTYRYTGPGLNPTRNNFHIAGAGQGMSVTYLGPGSRLVDATGNIEHMSVTGLTTSGGAGLFRSSRSAALALNGQRIFQHLRCINYTGCAIAADSIDGPSWQVMNCEFTGQNSESTTALALPGLAAGSLIMGNLFQKNCIDVKVRDAGPNVYLAFNSFIRLDSATARRVRLWVVPKSTDVNAGESMVVLGNKFGNENQDPDDFHILYADELAGSDNGSRLPDLATSSVGFVYGHQYVHNNISGAGPTGIPVIYSMVPGANLRRIVARPNNYQGTQPSSLLAFDAGVPGAPVALPAQDYDIHLPTA